MPEDDGRQGNKFLDFCFLAASMLSFGFKFSGIYV